MPRTYGVNVAITRCGNLYGPGDGNWERLFPGIIRQLLEGQRPIIRSDGTLTRDYLYVEDAARCYLLLAQAHVGPSRPGRGGIQLRLRAPPERARGRGAHAGAVGTSLEPDIRATASGEIFHQYLSADKARRRLLGWEPAHTFEEGLDRTVAWYRAALGR